MSGSSFGPLTNDTHITCVICVCTHFLLTGLIHRPCLGPALARTRRPTGTKPARSHLPSRPTHTRAEPARALMHDSARVRRPYVGGVPRISRGRTAPTPHCACDVSSRLALRMAGALVVVVVPACALACAPPPHPITSPEGQARSAPLFVQAPPAKSGQGASTHPPSALCATSTSARWGWVEKEQGRDQGGDGVEDELPTLMPVPRCGACGGRGACRIS
ncbi:hypothetical protein DFH08DRAFT_440428 [Mycena albidolilacea]|uniref:Uncharacterized protein n=1 Tax=Mycena albidolilacea TaxID=1033008 RepID=A0AAD7AGL8_9AGAR|nr:hypothetical protein DFH08DRAFT_440428 [Mycena albidolilacea]